MTNQQTANQFVQHCRTIIQGQKAGKVTVVEGAAQICKAFPKKRTHPMLDKIASLAFDVAEDYQGHDANIKIWKDMVAVVEAYAAHDWEPTCWMLSAMYGVMDNGQLTHSFSVVVKRQNGQTTVESAHDKLKAQTQKLLHAVNNEQTDEWYLKNLAELLPSQVEDLAFMSADVQEHLTRQWYSTFG